MPRRPPCDPFWFVSPAIRLIRAALKGPVHEAPTPRTGPAASDRRLDFLAALSPASRGDRRTATLLPDPETRRPAAERT